MTPTPWDPETEYELVRSDSPIHVDGYAEGSFKELRCAECGASVKLTEEPSAGVDDLSHDKDCSQRWARSEWWRDQLNAD